MGEPLLLGLDLTDREVLFVGAGEGTARQLPGFLATGARPVVVAPYAVPAVRELAAAGRITWHERAWDPADVDAVWLVHAATGDPELDRAITETARRRRVLCLTADVARVEAASGAVTATAPVTTAPSDVPPRSPREGWVALVGGGPGNPEFLTARARAVLAAADVVLADRLAPRDYAQVCPRAHVIDVGKAPGRHAMTQDEINTLIVDQALAGRGVVRLKGGDPYVFGRGGEERLACERAGLSVEVVPGVTSALAGPGAAGIPLTHRGLAGGFSVVEGHDLTRSLLADALPGGRDHTLVVLMGVRTLAATASLLAAGTRGPQCPVAIVERATAPDQRVTVGTLATIAETAQRMGVRNPAVIVVGDVVTLAYAWPTSSPSVPVARQRALWSMS